MFLLQYHDKGAITQTPIHWSWHQQLFMERTSRRFWLDVVNNQWQSNFRITVHKLNQLNYSWFLIYPSFAVIFEAIIIVPKHERHLSHIEICADRIACWNFSLLKNGWVGVEEVFVENSNSSTWLSKILFESFWSTLSPILPGILDDFYYFRQISVDILTPLSFWVELGSAVKLPSTHYDT